MMVDWMGHSWSRPTVLGCVFYTPAARIVRRYDPGLPNPRMHEGGISSLSGVILSPLHGIH
jgi:hypothetical protein